MKSSDEKRKVLLAAFDEATEPNGFSLSGYDIIEELDRGGMSVVYQARQLNPERIVALKVMLPKFADDPEMRSRFQREARAMAALDHPGIMPIFEVGETNRMPFLSMKLADGGSLAEQLKTSRPTIPRSVDLMLQICDAVHYAHQHGVLHRDLKPGNLLFTKSGDPLVGDFGVAKILLGEDGSLTRTEAFVGTPYYMPPEIAGGDAKDGSVASDLYSLGAIFYELLTGNRPHQSAHNVASLLRAIVDDPIPPPHLSGIKSRTDLEVICLKALEKEPAQRYNSVAEFRDDLLRWREGRVIKARPLGIIGHSTRWAKRHPLPAALILAMCLMAMTGAYFLNKSYHDLGIALHESLIEQARGERLVGSPGWRNRSMDLLKKSMTLNNSPQVREEALAAISGWDIMPAEDFDYPPTPNPSQEHKTISPDGKLTASGDGHGLSVFQSDIPSPLWSSKIGASRCPPVWSPDGRFLAASLGERKELLIFESRSGEEYTTHFLKAWPEQLQFHPGGELLAIVTSNRTLVLFHLWAREVLLELTLPHEGALHISPDGTHFSIQGESNSAWRLIEPAIFQEWRGQHLASGAFTIFAGKISPSEKYLLTISTAGLQTWNTENRSAIDFHPAENQTIDAKTDAWWLNEKVILLQVPGALEKIRVSPEGKFLLREKVPRTPGMKIRSVEENGDWLVSGKNEEGETIYERWPKGNSKTPLSLDSLPTPERSLHASSESFQAQVGRDQRIMISEPHELILTPPETVRLHQILYFNRGHSLLGITEAYRLVEWELHDAERILQKLGF